MLVIRLQRAGRKKTPFYRVVVAQKSAPIKGRFVERIGHYDPLSTPKAISLKSDRVEYWISVGATPSDTVARMLVKNGFPLAEKFVANRVMKPSNAEVEAKKKSAEEEKVRKEQELEKARLEVEAKVAQESAEQSSESESEEK